MLDYRKLLQLVDSLFDPVTSKLYLPINSAISNSYYLATGHYIANCKSYSVDLGSDGNNQVKATIIKTDNVEPIIDVLYVGKDIIYAIFLPTNFDENDSIDSAEERNTLILIIHDIFRIIVDSTRPNFPVDSILGEAIDFLPEYFTVITLKSWFSGLKYDYFNLDGFRYLSENVFKNIMEWDDKNTNYSLIYALLHDSK